MQQLAGSKVNKLEKTRGSNVIMKKLVAVEPRKAELVEYEDRHVQPNEVKIDVDFAAPKHGTEVIDFRGQTPFMGENLTGKVLLTCNNNQLFKS